MPAEPETARIIRVFVSSPSDIKAERGVLDEVVARINRTDGRARRARLELWKWEDDTVPQVGPKPQQVVDAQTPVYGVYLGIMAHRFGTPSGKYGSGTEKEFRDAFRRWSKEGSPWILFYFSRARVDPDELDLDQYARVKEFRQELEENGLYAMYEGVRGSDNAFFEQVDEHLRKILERAAPVTHGPPPQPGDPTKYLNCLLTDTAHIDIRGLQVGKGKANRFPIEELFISLTTTQAPTDREAEPLGRRKHRATDTEADLEIGESRTVPLHDALQHQRLVIVGDPGAGKTTFLRRVAHTLCQTQLRDDPDAARDRLGVTERTFPMLIRLSELAHHLSRHQHDADAPAGHDAPAWLPHYLAAAGKANQWGLDTDFFRQQLEEGLSTVLLDGLDEAPDRVAREKLSRLIEKLTTTYRGCRFVVTSRPAAYTDEIVLPKFAHARIDPLSDQTVETFLSRWCEALYAESEQAARDHRDELLTALRARPEIRRMARNPVMLTALAVVHWNERRLPEQRADLYESIIRWLSRSREQKPGREKAERAVILLQELALLMQDHPEGMRTQVPKRWAAEKLAAEWGDGKVDKESIQRAEMFLDAEEMDSGIVVGRGSDVQFWHRTFQEFLAARAIAARPEAGQNALLWGPPVRLYLPEWREAVLLLAGVLHVQGPAKVDNLVRFMLKRLGAKAQLADEARCAGLLGAILRDLAPVDYDPPDEKYRALLDRVMAIFDRKRSENVPIETRIAAADALGQAGDPRIDFHNDDYWATIPAGKFMMGAQSKKPKKPNYDKEAFDDRESPVHEVHLDEFRMARYPVTVGQYQQFIEDDGYKDERWWAAGGFDESPLPEKWEDQVQYPSRPVVYVSWYESMAYCAWAGYRLPTDAEWERAARGTGGRKYPWGGAKPDSMYMNFNANIGHPTPVGIYPRDSTPERICDMGGNVREWCADSYADYSTEPVSNPRGPQEATLRVFRGGGWASPAGYCRSAYRIRGSPEDRNYDLGFRVAPVPPGKGKQG